MLFTCPYCSQSTGVTAEGLVEHIKGHHPHPPQPEHLIYVDLQFTVEAHNSDALARLLSAALRVQSDQDTPAAPSAVDEKGGRS